MDENTAVEDHISAYGLTLNDDRKWWQPQFEIIALMCIHAGDVHMGSKEVHHSWHWTFRKGRDAMKVLHADLIQQTMMDQAYHQALGVRDPDGPPEGFDGNVL